MAKFAVSYQLNKHQDYPKIWGELERLNGHKAMRSFYLLDLDFDSASEVRDHLKQFVDEDDMLFVARMDARPASHRCYQGTIDWINKRF